MKGLERKRVGRKEASWMVNSPEGVTGRRPAVPTITQLIDTFGHAQDTRSGSSTGVDMANNLTATSIRGRVVCLRLKNHPAGDP